MSSIHLETIRYVKTRLTLFVGGEEVVIGMLELLLVVGLIDVGRRVGTPVVGLLVVWSVLRELKQKPDA